jgi:hypothetical protein
MFPRDAPPDRREVHVQPRRTATFALVLLLAAALPAGSGPLPSPPPHAASGAAAAPDVAVALGRTALGRSGALRVTLALPGERIALPLEWSGGVPDAPWYRWRPATPVAGRELGTAAGVALPAAAVRIPEGGRVLGGGGVVAVPAAPGIYDLELGWAGGGVVLSEARLIVLVPAERKRNGYLNGYSIGSYPHEGSGRRDRYAPPAGYIEVTAETRHIQLSEHFRIGEFLTKDQPNVWPKYVVIEPRLIDKLELVIAELNAMGVPARRMVVMSGYRTPRYNRQGLSNGRANLSRHQYGDAADVWVDNDGDWYMDDLNGDGRRDTGDARVMLEAVDRVEARYPELLGGAGIYRDNGVHGPFIHIDVRGGRSRW